MREPRPPASWLSDSGEHLTLIGSRSDRTGRRHFKIFVIKEISRCQCERGKATVFTAEQDFAVAKLTVNEYLEGTYVKELQTVDSLIAVAEQNQKAARNLLEHSETMFRKGHINQLQLDTNRDSVARAKLDLASAKTTRKVLVEFTWSW